MYQHDRNSHKEDSDQRSPASESAAALTDHTADAIRDAVIHEIHAAENREDSFLDLLRVRAKELAALAAEGWHDPLESFEEIEQAALATRQAPPAAIRGILVACFPELCIPRVAPISSHRQTEHPSDFRASSRRRMADAHEGDRLRTFQEIAMECGAAVRDTAMKISEARALLKQLADDSGLSNELRSDDLRHVVSECLKGRAGIPTAKPAREGAKSKERKLVVSCAADIRVEPIAWFWPQRIATGKLTLLAGQPGLGKSQVTAALAAATTTGANWPCDEGTAPLGSVIVLSAEDDPADTQVPRLLAAGADLSRVHIISAVRENDASGNRTFNIQADMDLIERQLDSLGDVSLITVDPLSSYLGKVDSHNNSDVRSVLEHVSEMAARRRVAVVGVTHFNKGAGAAIDKIIGSIAFVAAARAAFMIAADPEDEKRRLFVGIKNNVGRTSGALAFSVEEKMVGDNSDIAAPYIVWEPEPEPDITANEILAASYRSSDEPTAKAELVGFLSVLLASGPVAAEDIEKEAVAAGLLKPGMPIGKDKAFRLAKKELGIGQKSGTVYREGGIGFSGHWFWRLPNAA